MVFYLKIKLCPITMSHSVFFSAIFMFRYICTVYAYNNNMCAFKEAPTRPFWNTRIDDNNIAFFII